MAGTNSLEIEIHSLFQENASVDYVCRELVSKYERSDAVSAAEIEGISHLLTSFGRYDLLQKFYLKCLKQQKIATLPVGFLFNCLLKFYPQKIDSELMSLLDGLIARAPQDLTALQNPELCAYSIPLQQRLKNESELFSKERIDLKAKLIEQLDRHRLYQLKDQEELAINQLIKLFPQDIQVSILQQAHLEKKADDILSKISTKKTLVKPKSHSHAAEDADSAQMLEELKTNLQNMGDKIAHESPEQLYNLAVLAFQFEFFELSLSLLEKAPETHSSNWLKAEVLYECGRYLDLLKLIEDLEKKPSSNAEDSYGATYLKALAYYELGQKDLAIRLMSSLARAVPFYRSSEALLREWTQT